MPRSYLNRLVQEHKRCYGGKIEVIRRDMSFLERVLSASLQDSDERLSETNPKLERRFALLSAELGIDYHVLAYVLSDLTGKRDETHLNRARELLKQMQEVQSLLSPRG